MRSSVNGETRFESPSRRPDERAGMASMTAVIVNWNTPDYTIKSARALIDEGVQPHRIVVVDNGSADDSFKRFEESLSACVLLHLPQNIGFGRASNAGARALEADSYLFVNNDAFVHRPGSISELLSTLADDSVGVAVPRLLNPDLTLQRNVVPLNSPIVALVRASGLSRFIPNRWQARWSTHWRHDRSRRIQAANGAVLLVRRELWRRLGGFAEGNLMYAEDLDLCWRAHKLGWQVRFAADAEFVHIGNVASRRVWNDPRRAELKGRAEAAMIRRHLAFPSAAATIAIIVLGLLARFMFFWLTRNRAAAATARAAMRGYVWSGREQVGEGD